jgi:hypothetical protein
VPDAFPGPAVLVPVTVEALVVTEACAARRWSWAAPAYANLAGAQPVERDPFVADAPRIGAVSGWTGAIVHWALPDALTRGKQDAAGTIGYPPAPNRWLVTRKAPAAQPGTWAFASWVVTSDRLLTPADRGDATARQGSPFPQGTGGTLVGRAVPLASWTGEPDGATWVDPPLTAVGPGDPTFAAFAPTSLGVFSFPDPLTGVRAGQLAYTVCGWHADPAHDPLAGTGEAELRAALAGLDWALGDPHEAENRLADAIAAARAWDAARASEAPSGIPARTIYHGLVFDLAWPGAKERADSAVPPTRPERPGWSRPVLAIAHSTADAVGAMAGDADETLVRLIGAFDAGTLRALDAPDGRAQLALQEQAGWFEAREGGLRWTVRDPANAASLTALNEAQRALDACARELAARQWEAYAAWWKATYAPLFDATAPDPQDARGAAESALAGWRAARVRRDRGLVDLAGVELVPVPLQPFWAPADPVLVVRGAHRSFKHGADGRFAPDGTLACRFSGQTLGSLRVPGRDRPVGRADLPVPAIDAPGVPPEAADVVLEGFLLDVTSAPWIAAVAAPEDPWSSLDAIRRRQTLVWSGAARPELDEQTLAEAAGLASLHGATRVPSKVGVEVWSPPWTPLFLCWEVEFTPAALDAWQLAGAVAGGAAVAWEWSTGAAHAPPLRLSGRALLTDRATEVLARRLAATLDAPPGGNAALLAAVRAAEEYARHADLLAQALGGFGLALLERDARAFRAPPPELAALLSPSDAPRLLPDAAPWPGAPAGMFHPLRAGHLALRRLWVVDAFGQVFDVLEAIGTGSSLQAPKRPPDLQPGDGRPERVELKPRLAQPARLALTLRAADDDAAEVGVVDGANPVCGWLIANPLDGGLLVYDAAGALLGELLSTPSGGVWAPPPEAPPGGARAIANAHLAAVVDAILAADAGLDAVLELVDRVAWTVDPTTAWADDELPLLLGRPIAVVRAALALELGGPPVTAQGWSEGGSGGVEALELPVVLGSEELLDDGLVGAFVGDRYDVLASERPPAPGGFVQRRRPAVRAAGLAIPLTLLMTARGSVHAATGLLPVTSAALPEPSVGPALARIQAVFRAGPLPAAAGAVAVPLPALDDGRWTWLERLRAHAPAAELPLADADAGGRVTDAPAVVREGWLRLLLGADTLLDWTVEPSVLACGTPAALVLGGFNATGAPAELAAVELELPLGADGLAEPATALLARVTSPEGWTARATGPSTVALVPDRGAPPLDAGASLAVELAGILVPGEEGATGVTVRETLPGAPHPHAELRLPLLRQAPTPAPEEVAP